MKSDLFEKKQALRAKTCQQEHTIKLDNLQAVMIVYYAVKRKTGNQCQS